MFGVCPETPRKTTKRVEREPLSPVNPPNVSESPSGLKKSKTLFSQSSIMSMQTPRPPRQKNLFSTPKPAAQIEPPIISPFKVQADSLSNENPKITFQQKEFSVLYCNEGTFSKVYKIVDEKPVFASLDNREIIVKAFHGEKMGFNQEKLDSYLSNIKYNYEKVIQAKLPVGVIHNLSSLKTDRCVFQQYIPDKLNVMSKSHLEQVKPFFKASTTNQIVMDLQPQNFRVKDGKVYLIDFVEEVKPQKYSKNINMFNFKAIAAWFEAFMESGMLKEEAIKLLIDLSGYSEDEILEIDTIRMHGMKISPVPLLKSLF